MLLEDHAHQCVACRKVLFGERSRSRGVEMPARRMTRITVDGDCRICHGRADRRDGGVMSSSRRLRPAAGLPFRLADGSVYRLHNGMLQPVSTGMELAEGEVLRTAAGSHAMVKLMDQSVVEVGERAEFRVSREAKGHDHPSAARRRHRAGGETR